MNSDNTNYSIRRILMNYQDMIGVQLSSFAALPFWYPLYPKKLEHQVLAISLKTLKELPSEPIKKIFRSWTGIRAEMVFQPFFPIIFESKQFILSQMTQKGQSTMRQEILASAIAGGMSGPIANIMNVIIIRMKQYPHETSTKAIKSIWKQLGPATFIRGSLLMSLRNCGFGGVFFGLNPQITKSLNEKIDLPQPYKGIAVSIASAIPSAITACIFTMPFDNGSVRRQVSGIGINNFQSTLQMIKQVYLQHGWKGFFVGTHLRIRASIIEFTAFNIFFTLYNQSFMPK